MRKPYRTSSVPIPDAALLTVGEVAKITGLSVYKVARLADRGVFESDRTEGGHRRIRSGSVDAYLASDLVATDGVAS